MANPQYSPLDEAMIFAPEPEDPLLPLVVRLAGTNAEEGLALLKDTDLIPAATMQEAAQKIVSLVGND